MYGYEAPITAATSRAAITARGVNSLISGGLTPAMVCDGTDSGAAFGVWVIGREP